MIYLLKRFSPYFARYKGVLILDLLCAMLTTSSDLILPLLVRKLTNTAMYDMASLTILLIVKVSTLYLVLRVIDVIANYYMANTGHIMGAHIETDMRRDLFSHLQDLSYSYYSNTKIGQLMSRITTDLFDVTEFAHHGPEEYFIGVIKIVVTFIILAQMNLSLTLIIFIVLPFLVWLSVIQQKNMRTAFKKSRSQLGEINAQVEDSLSGIRVVKSFAGENREEKKFEKGNSKFLDIKKETYKYMARFQSTVRLFDGINYIVVVAAGSIYMYYDKITAPEFMTYLLYISLLMASVRRLVEFTESFQRGMTGIERFVEVMDEPIDIHDKEGAITLGAEKEIKGEIHFDHVHFHYDDSDIDVLDNINLHIKSGEHVALVGPSGSGKTTICNLIPRFYDVTEGHITIDDTNIKDTTLHSLRSKIGVVQQDVYLFSGSVLDNIEYGRPGATRDEVIHAAKLAGADEFISELNDGYDTYVGERGVKLSGGQKQRISIARVFLKNPPILILDEATSALDNESEHIVQQSLEKLAVGRTTLTIAHRLTTIKNADTILVLTDNGIEEKGSHKELIANGGLYAKLYGLYTDRTSGVEIGD
ncbi:MAG: ABC transporter ATP-binding protein/permease [Clostridiales Family XIII bacterium]|nr:ABC transporter ATP-binding protein/permease [Clostridiales Family XIII bacterium]